MNHPNDTSQGADGRISQDSATPKVQGRKVGHRRETAPEIVTCSTEDIKRWQREARLDEMLNMRTVGDAIAAQPGAGFEELCQAYDNHILKRVADLTGPEL